MGISVYCCPSKRPSMKLAGIFCLSIWCPPPPKIAFSFNIFLNCTNAKIYHTFQQTTSVSLFVWMVPIVDKFCKIWFNSKRKKTLTFHKTFDFLFFQQNFKMIWIFFCFLLFLVFLGFLSLKPYRTLDYNFSMQNEKKKCCFIHAIILMSTKTFLNYNF